MRGPKSERDRTRIVVPSQPSRRTLIDVGHHVSPLATSTGRPSIHGRRRPSAPAVPSACSSSKDRSTRPARWFSMSSRPWCTLTATAVVTPSKRASAWSTSGRSPMGHSTFGRILVSGRRRPPAPAARTTPARLSAMQTRRWVNPTLPQTMQIAVFLLYFEAGSTLLFGLEDQYAVLPGSSISGGLISNPVLRIGLPIAMAAAAYLIANEKKRGYLLGIAVAA